LRNLNYIKGILFSISSLLLISIEPIIANSRPSEIDAYLYAMMTVIYEAIIFFPLFLIERHKIKATIMTNPPKSEENYLLLNGWKKHKNFLIYLGINFAVAQVLFLVAFKLAGAINASLASQTSIIFGLLFGFLINHEKISITQILFSIILLFGLTLAVTQGSFDLLEFNVGVFIMIITTFLWMLAHSLARPILGKNELSSIQIVFIRNILNSIVLFSTYFIFYPIENIFLIFNPINQVFFILMGIAYSFDLYCWYKALSFIDVSTATILVSPTPILIAVFATIILGEIFTVFHLIGAIIIIISIIVIVQKKSR